MKAEKQEFVLEPYLATIDAIMRKMEFHLFDNGRPYSFDYHLKDACDTVIKELQSLQKQYDLPGISPKVTNRLPIFLPPQTCRIAFFSYQSKSVRPVRAESLISILYRQAEKRAKEGEFPATEIDRYVNEDLDQFQKYDATHRFDAYRRDIVTRTIQFNAYDQEDTLLIEKSFVRGGLVFDMKPEQFKERIAVTYPRHRKQRSDKKNDYLPLKLIKIRGITLPKEI